MSYDPNSGDNTSMLLISTTPANATGTVFSLSLPVVDMVADPIRGGMFLAVDRQMPDWGNGVVYFDPRTGLFSHSTFVGADINRLAVSSDGQVLYASSVGQVCKLDAVSLAVLSDFALTQGYSASELKVFPDDVDRVAVWHQADSFGGYSIGLGIYAGGTLLASTNIEPTGRFRQISAAGTNSGVRVFDSWDGLEVLSFSSPNSVLTNDLAISYSFLDYRGEIKCVDDRFYAPYGGVYALGSDRVLGTFNVPGIDGWPNTSSGAPLVEPDVANGRVFFLRYTGTEVKLHAFDDSRYQIIGSMVVPGVAVTPSRLIRWGSDGLAFKTDKLFIVQSRLVPSGSEADLSPQLSGGANPGRQGQSESYSLSITNYGPEAATGIVATASFSASGVISGITASQGSTVVSNLLLSWDVGSLVAGGSASADFSFTPGAGGILQVVASVSGHCRDRNPANDSDVHLEAVTNAAWFSQLTQLSLPVKDVISDLSRSNLIVSLHELGGVVGNSIIKLNPQSGVIAGPVFVGSSPNHLAMSPDGSKLFVGLDGASSVQELDAATLQATSSFSIGNGLRGDMMEVVPGAAQRLLVYRANAGLSVFDQGVEGSNKLSNISTFAIDDLTGDAFACNRSYSGVPLYRLAIDANGVTVAQTLSSSLQQSQSDLKSANGRLYYDRGLVVSAALASEVARYPVSQFAARVQPAPDRQLVYYLTGLSGKWTARGFRDASAQPMGMFTVFGVNGSPGRLARSGNTGLAFATSADQLFLLRDMFTSDGPVADVAIRKLSAPRTALPGATSSLYLHDYQSLSLRGDHYRRDADFWIFAGGFQQVQPSTGNVQINGTQIVWSVGDLAGNASAQISVQLLPSTPQTITHQSIVVSALLEFVAR